MALGGKHAGPQAASCRPVGKMAGDSFAVLENMAVAIDDFQLFPVMVCVAVLRLSSGFTQWG
jgi:hypothetical protein